MFPLLHPEIQLYWGNCIYQTTSTQGLRQAWLLCLLLYSVNICFSPSFVRRRGLCFPRAAGDPQETATPTPTHQVAGALSPWRRLWGECVQPPTNFNSHKLHPRIQTSTLSRGRGGSDARKHWGGMMLAGLLTHCGDMAFLETGQIQPTEIMTGIALAFKGFLSF